MEILSLGEKIKKLRKRKNMTLKDLAGDRITAAQISHIERDKSNTSYDLLEYLADKLGVNVEYLLETKEVQAKKIVDNLILSSEISLNNDDLFNAEETIRESIELCKEYNLIENFGKCSFLLANIRLKQGDYDLTIDNFEKALFYFIRNNDNSNMYKCYVNIGDIYTKQNLDSVALTHYKFAEVLVEDEKMDDYISLKDLYSKMALAYIKTNKAEKSLKYIEKINELEGENAGEKELELILMKANNLLKLSRFEESKTMFESALSIIKDKNKQQMLADIYLNISDVYIKLGDIEKTIEYSQKSYDLTKESGEYRITDGLFRIVDAYIKKKDYTIAKKYCKITLATAIKSKDKEVEYRVLKKYSEIYAGEGDYATSVEYLNKGVEIVKSLQKSGVLADFYIELGKIYSNISKNKELEYYKKGIEIKESEELIAK
ncbi:MAG: helix-turn-helix domain-containing protein [Clostridioides sp.]|nr:helix-turn-helix domain-containing protein [Clostridioides sp.]